MIFAFLVALLVVGVAGFVVGAVAAHRRHYLPSYRERWQQACRINEKQYEALERAVNALETEDAKERGQAISAARGVMQARINKDWDAKAKASAKAKAKAQRDLVAYAGRRQVVPSSRLSRKDLERILRKYSA